MSKTLVLADKNPIGSLTDAERSAVLDDVLERYSKDEQIVAMASDYGVSHTILYRNLIAERQEEFRQAQVARAMGHFEQAANERDQCVEKLRTAENQLELNRYAQLLKAAESTERRSQWLLERCLPKLYGQDKAQGQAPVAIQINLRRDTKDEVTIEAP